MTVVRGLSREDRRMLEDERRGLRAALEGYRRAREGWPPADPSYPALGTLEYATVVRETRARLAEIEEEMAS